MNHNFSTIYGNLAWVNAKYEYSNEGDEYILFGDKLYIFNGMTMLTVLPTPTRSYLYPTA